MNKPAYTDLSPLPGETHQVTNVSRDLVDFNLFASDTPLTEAVAREGAESRVPMLSDFGAMAGTAGYLELGHLANRYPPELDTHDRFGNRVDLVRYHDAYHRLMRSAMEHGLHSLPWTDNNPGRFVTRAALSLMQGQVEAGHGCPVTMTFASIPSIRCQPDLAAVWEPKILANAYDPRNIPAHDKQAVTVGMGMTEKQGGSDVRANTTRAIPLGAGGPGQLYQLVGHKWFLSAPMCDLFLVLARTDAGVSCFLVPRWLEDGSKNALQVIRLKDKMGNRSNASSEVEFRGAHGWMVGEEGRGVRTIIEMVAMTRFDCIIGSSALLRMGVAQAIHHCQHRAAFGALLIDQPLMRNVLADLALEYEGAIALGMRLGRALEHREDDEQEARLLRLGLPLGKYWVCKRTPQHTYEVMECIGGSGVMENSIFPRLYREAVINPIWEGSGNVQCLDALRAMGRDAEVVHAFMDEVAQARGGNRFLDEHVAGIRAELSNLDALEFRARGLVDRMALALQAALLVRNAPQSVADAFCASRLGARGQHSFGILPKGTDVAAIIERADPAKAL